MAIGGCGREVRLGLVALVLGLMASCGGDTTNVAGSATPSSETITVPPTPTPSGASVDDPTTPEIEVVGEVLARKTGKFEECTSAGDVARCVGAPWVGDYSVSDPRLSGHADVVFSSETGPGDRFQWWLISVLRTDEGSWEGLNTGEIQADGVHIGDGIYLGSGELAGLEFREHLYMGPGADTSRGDAFEVTGYVHQVAVDGWEPDLGFSPARTREIVGAATRAWSAGDGDAALELYADDAVFVDIDGSTTEGRAAIASLIASDVDVGFKVELLPPPFVRGNYAAGAFRWTNDTDEGWVLAVFRIDEAGQIVRHEVIGE